MPTTYLPSREAELVTWAENFSARVFADPAAYGLIAPQADAYVAAKTNFVTAYQTASEPTTRTPSNVEVKNMAKAALIALTREYVRIIQAFPGTTDPQRVDLGITVPDTELTAVPVPTQEPQLDVASVNGRTMKLRLRDSQTGERRKPAGVVGATVLSFVGQTIPEDIRQWHFEGNTNRVDVDVVFGEAVPMGAKVWLTAFWFNRKSESGPACPPVSAHVGYGGLSQGGGQ